MTAAALLPAVRPFVDSGAVPGAVVGVLRAGEVSLAAIGATAPGGSTAMDVDAVVRISSTTKPVVAALALALAEDGALALHDPVDRFVPELADRRVLRRLDGPLDDTVPAQRPVTVEDLLTMRLGFGFVVEGDCPALQAATRAGLGIGPPDPSLPLTPEEWIARFAELPLMDQPGTTWRYDLAFAVLGVVLARAGGAPLEDLLSTRLLGPLGMADTGFIAPPGRLPPCFATTASGLAVFDDAVGSRWTTPPSFPDARGGLASTAPDLLRFAAALLAGGGGVLSPEAVAALTTDQLTPEQRRGPSARAFLDGSGWGYGLQVHGREHEGSARLPRYGWAGGLGTLWYCWPEQDAAAVLLTQVLPPSEQLVSAFFAGMEDLLAAP